jgi:transmembrane sensor
MEQNTNELARLAAVRWYARLRAPDCTQSERNEFEQWLKASADNARAYIRAEKLAYLVAAATKKDSRFSQLAETALAKPKQSDISRWQVAAALIIGIALALFGIVNQSHLGGSEAVTAYHNSTKQQQRYVLQDGSVVFLDVNSSMNVNIGKVQRNVSLLRGRAYFEVVHDVQKPFLVYAGNLRTTDLGTRFEVALSEQRDVSVTLVDGAIEVANQRDKGRAQQSLIPGEQVVLRAGAMSLEKHEVDAAAVTSWSSGRLVFKGTPLATALDELNRYSDCKIVLGDSSLASVPIGGNFIAGADSTQVVDALAAVLPIRVVHVGLNEIVLFQRN